MYNVPLTVTVIFIPDSSIICEQESRCVGGIGKKEGNQIIVMESVRISGFRYCIRYRYHDTDTGQGQRSERS